MSCVYIENTYCVIYIILKYYCVIYIYIFIFNFIFNCLHLPDIRCKKNTIKLVYSLEQKTV